MERKTRKNDPTVPNLTLTYVRGTSRKNKSVSLKNIGVGLSTIGMFTKISFNINTNQQTGRISAEM